MATERAAHKLEHLAVEWRRADGNEADAAAEEGANLVEDKVVPEGVVVPDAILQLLALRLVGSLQHPRLHLAGAHRLVDLHVHLVEDTRHT